MSLVTLRREPDAVGRAARRFVREILEPAAARTDSEGAVPEEIAEKMRQLGYFGLTVPTEYGGAGLSLSAYLEVVRELARTNLAFEELTEENNGIGSTSLLLAGTDEQKRTWLPRIASGEILCSFALTEPDAGSDAAAIQTKAERVDGAYLLNGRKHFITHGANAGLVTVVARTADDGNAGRLGFTLFLVTPDMDGFTVVRQQPMMGYKASGQAELLFEDVVVPLDQVLGEPGDGFRTAMQTLDRGRLTVTADCLGVGETLLDWTIQYAADRSTFGAPLASRGEVREMLARSAMDLFAIESQLFAFAELVDDGVVMRGASDRLKLFASEAVGRIADRAMQIHGGLGYTVEAQIERFYRDVRLLRIAEGPSEVLRAAIARRALASAESYEETTL